MPEEVAADALVIGERYRITDTATGKSYAGRFVQTMSDGYKRFEEVINLKIAGISRSFMTVPPGRFRFYKSGESITHEKATETLPPNVAGRIKELMGGKGKRSRRRHRRYQRKTLRRK